MTKIKVALRVRPLSPREVSGRYPVVVGIDENSAFITDIRLDDSKVPERPSADSRQRFRQFDFDHAFWLTEGGDDGSSQEEIYEEMGPSLEESILEGYNACLLAYGQSGTGKTHTMLGTKEDPGLIPRLCEGLWGKFKTHCSTGNKTFRMEVSFMEIYREKVRDLLTPSEKPLKLREHPQLGPHVQGLKRIEINEGLSILDLLWEGERRRATGTTGSNRRSSRSHAIWTLYLTSTKRSLDGSELITRNQVHLVDLAGSERADLITTKHLLAEGKDINRSLVSLGNVISSLAERAHYIPYRDSTLTWLLKDSLGGNATTAIIITASPASCCHAQTLNSLRFAQRARLVENQPKINVTKSEGKKKGGVGMFTGISTFDLKKDISRLASIIRTAQTNGGILRNLSPANGWNRLISAIENWNHIDNGLEQGHNNIKRGVGVNGVSVMETTGMNPSVASRQMQVDLKSKESMIGSSSSVPLSRKNLKQGNEIFIPLSNSFKCLTWRQEEVQQLPKSSDSEDEVFVSPPTTPKMDSRVNQMKYILPVHFPVTRNVDPDARISERIHGKIEKLKEPIQIYPVEIQNRFESSPVICGKYPTLVNPQPISHSLKESARDLVDENLNYVKSVQCQGQQESNFSFNIPSVSDFSNQTTLPIPVFQSTDEDEEDIHSWPQLRHSKYRAVPARRVIQSEDGQGTLFNHATFNDSLISSSSYESIQIPKNIRQHYSLPVKIVQHCNFNFADIEDRVENFNCPCQHQMASVSCVGDSEEGLYNFSQSPPYSSDEVKIPLNGSTASRFRNHFIREINELDNIGKQIKNLKLKTERYNILKPYLTQIDKVMLQDHTKPELELDAEIEQCSGWNVAIEFQKVQNEIKSINKILQRGAAKSHSESSLSNPESSGSISWDSRRSSNASNHNDILYRSRSTGMTAATQRKTKPVPILTSTPKKPPTPHSPSTFWSEFYKKSGPGGDVENFNFSKLHSEAEHRINQRWRPFLPKTHNYLCHQQKGSTSLNWSNAHSKSLPYVQESHSLSPSSNQIHAQHLRQSQHIQRRHHLLHSLSSSGGSSLYDGSQSDPYLPPGCYGSTELCSCLDSLETNHPYWDTGFETEFPNQNPHESYDHQNIFSNADYPTHAESRSTNYPKHYLVIKKENRNGSNFRTKYNK